MINVPLIAIVIIIIVTTTTIIIINFMKFIVIVE